MMDIRVLLAAALGICGLLGAVRAHAQVPTAVTVDVPSTLQTGDALTIVPKMHVHLGQCPASAVGGTLTFKPLSGTPQTSPVSGTQTNQVLAQTGYYTGYLECANGVYSDGARFIVPLSHAGTYTFSVDYSGTSGIGPSSTGPVTVQVVDAFTGTTGQGEVKLNVAGVPSEFYCRMHTASIHDGSPPGAPAGLSFPDGYASYDFRACLTECNGICPPPPDAPAWAGQVVTLQVPQPPAPGSKVWVYAPGGGMTTPVWRKIEPLIVGNTVTFVVTGNGGELELNGTLAIANGDGNRSDLQDLWWGGPQENGWGVGISQIGDRMFLGLYVYGIFSAAPSSPVWLVMPGGTWDAAHTTFSGSVYVPRSPNSSYAAYSSRNLFVGPAVMNGKITFSGTTSAQLELAPVVALGDYATIRKSLVRQPFGTSPQQGPFAGLWWGGATQNGWGISLAQQGDTLFGVWYTYDKFGGNSTNTWFVIPGGTWISRTAFGGAYKATIYRTSGSFWGVAAAYDPSKLVVTPAGTMTITFYTPDLASMNWTIDGDNGYYVPLYKQPF